MSSSRQLPSISLIKFSGVAAVCLALVVPWIVAIVRGDFDLRSRYISELGARGEPFEMIVRWVSFFPSGVLFSMFAFYVIRPLVAGKMTWFLIGLWGVGWLASAIFPCDPGCPFTGTLSQLIHGYVVLPFYVFGFPFGLALFGRQYRKRTKWKFISFFSFFTAVAFVVCYSVILPGFFPAYRGVIQWMGELLVGAWVIWLTVLHLAEEKAKLNKTSHRELHADKE